MAFKMNPGRGNYSKTGHGIPSPFKQVDAEVDKLIALKKARTENEMKAKADSTGVDKRMKDAGFGNIMSGEYGNKKANETRANLKGQFTYSMDKDKATGKYKKKWSDSPAKQVDKEVDALIARKKEREAKAKNDKARKEGEEGMAADNRKIRIKLRDENRAQASSDSTAVDKKMRAGGFGSIMSGEMGNKKANETRKASTAYANSYESVDKDKSTGKYKRNINFKDSPAKQCFPSPKEKAGNQKANEDRQKGYPGDKTMAKGPSKDRGNDAANLGRQRPGTKYESGQATGKVYKDSPAKQLGRQAVTKMGGKKTPAKMKSC